MRKARENRLRWMNEISDCRFQTAFRGRRVNSVINGHENTKARRRMAGLLRGFVSSWPINAADYADAAESGLVLSPRHAGDCRLHVLVSVCSWQVSDLRTGVKCRPEVRHGGKVCPSGMHLHGGKRRTLRKVLQRALQASRQQNGAPLRLSSRRLSVAARKNRMGHYASAL
jgi:hypothetical protein